MITVERVLATAGAILSNRNAWMQNDFHNGPKPKRLNDGLAKATAFCSLGAIYEAYRRHGSTRNLSIHHNPAETFLRDMIRQESGYQTLDLWNDSPERKHNEVVAMFEKAAAAAAEKGV